MINKIFQKHVKDDFVIIDSQFPQKQPLGFRNTEINEYLARIKNAKAYTMYPMLPGVEAWFAHGYGVDMDTYNQNKKGYLKKYPKNSNKIEYLEPHKSYRFKLAYSFFLAETYVLLPFLEKNKIPFVFVLYPGGAFGLNNKKSDSMLQSIFRSKYFRGVIVTQNVTKKYILEKQLCTVNKIKYIFGGFSQYIAEQVLPKKRYLIDKDTFDICFIGGKYTEKGVDKGYDLFIEVAKKLSSLTKDINFHVVGGFNREDIDISDINSRITFYGYKDSEYLLEFYSRMDIQLTPNRPFMLYPGNFDGFPLGGDGPFCGVAMFGTDELGLSKGKYIPDKDIVIVEPDANMIADKIMYYYNHIGELYDLAESGGKKTRKLINTEVQISNRMSFFNKFTNIELNG